jgi:hypothetical protein
MKLVGIVTTALVAAGAAFGVVLGARSLPDIRRYARIRSM